MEVERIGIIRIKKEHKSNEMLLAIIFCLPMFFSNISEILLAFGFSGIMSLNYILLYALTLIVLMRTFLRRPERTICVIISAGLLIVISCLLNNDVYAYIFNFGHFSIHEIFQSNIMMFITRCIFPIIVFAGELDICKLTEHLKQYSLSLTVIYIVMNIVNFAIYSKTTNYMTNAYMALVPVALLYGSSFSNRQTFRFLVSVFASILIVVSGSRGAALCMIGFIGMYHIISRKLTLKKLVLVLVIIISAVVVILNIGNILVFLSEVFRKMGVSTRLIDLINGKETGIFQLSGRDDIYAGAVNELKFFGLGLFSDRVLRTGGYVHNFVLEVILDFGYLFGIPILIFLFTKTVKGVILLRNEAELEIWAAIVVVVLGIKYMVSDSYLISQDFWLLIGIVFKISSARYKSTEMLSAPLANKKGA